MDTHAYALAAVAMVSAAIAAFFYLRVAVTMFSPVGPVGERRRWTADPAPARRRTAPPGPAPARRRRGRGRRPGEAVASLRVLTDAPPAESVTDRGVVPVPPLTALAIGLSVAFTVVFGIIPGPILDFAHQATLLFT